MLVVSQAHVVALQSEGTADYPFIGWQNLATVANVTAGSERRTIPPPTSPTLRRSLQAGAAQRGVHTHRHPGHHKPVDYLAITAQPSVRPDAVGGRIVDEIGAS